MYGEQKKIHKNKLLVELELDSGSVLTGHVFVGQQQRLSDLMNDEREFLPFEALDGSITIFTKWMARRITPLDKPVSAANETDPYRILGVTAGASDAELRDAYHRKVQESHPDRLAGMGLSPAIVKYAHECMARINEAYNRVRNLRRQAANSANGRAAE
jgi:hypothetical protein